jgi:hypothetical protein
MNSSEDKNFLDSIKDKGQNLIDDLKNKFLPGKPWPQTETPSADLTSIYPGYKTRGFLPPILISPTKTLQKDKNNDDENNAPPNPVKKTFGKYTYTDWRGHTLELSEDLGLGVGDTKDRFNLSKTLPKIDSELVGSPYSIRDYFQIFNDPASDYFRNGLQVLDNVNSIMGPEFWDTQKSKETAGKTRLGSFKTTPFENNDPVIFGFEIIIDDISSPLLNGSINDFLQLFGPNISEMNARIPVYEEFKQQFIKFFKTRATVRIDDSQTSITAMRPTSYADVENNTGLFGTGKKAYMNYYLKKVAGLSKLIEGNTAEIKNFITDYNKDLITLTFTEDVSLSLGTLASLYKLLYWSKPNAKTMIPENLLRFNCDIIVSEVRNYNRVRKSVTNGDIEVIKDNVSRYVYSLKECQFYFTTMPHDDAIDLAAIKTFDTFDLTFDYKYSSVKFERFVPTSDGFGQYVGYDGGAIWKIGNIGARENLQAGTRIDKSTPLFFTVGGNKFNDNGVLTPIITAFPGKNQTDGTVVIGPDTQEQNFESGDVDRPGKGLENFAQKSKQTAKKFKQNLQNTLVQSLNREKSFAIATTTGLLNKTLNKILNAQGLTGITPPKNIYTDAASNPGSRIFYDVRGQLMNFVGDSLGNILRK